MGAEMHVCYCEVGRTKLRLKRCGKGTWNWDAVIPHCVLWVSHYESELNAGQRFPAP